MEIKKEIVQQLHKETGDGMLVCKAALRHFDGDFARAKRSLEKHQWQRPLCGVVCLDSDIDIDRIRYTGGDDFDQFDFDFWHNKFFKREEVYLKADGTIDYDKSDWPKRIADIREAEAIEAERRRLIDEEIAAWKIPTVADIIMSSVKQFKDKVKFRDQYFTYKFTKKYLEEAGMAYSSYYHKGDKDFSWLKFPMEDYMKWNKIDFDGSKYTFNGKSVLLKELLKKV